MYVNRINSLRQLNLQILLNFGKVYAELCETSFWVSRMHHLGQLKHFSSAFDSVH